MPFLNLNALTYIILFYPLINYVYLLSLHFWQRGGDTRVRGQGETAENSRGVSPPSRELKSGIIFCFFVAETALHSLQQFLEILNIFKYCFIKINYSESTHLLTYRFNRAVHKQPKKSTDDNKGQL
uniref:Uncharacterized protein n=1 Tax=Globodera rostochiensis TaxID=31243 RepID=A0A914I5U3_GLORO